MPMTLAQIQAEVLERLQKSSGYSGFYTPEKVRKMTNDSITYVAARMMRYGFGWLQKIGYITTSAGTASYSLPADAAILKTVRYKQGSTYVPLQYNGDLTESQEQAGQSSQYPSEYRLLERTIYFNPAPADVGTDYLQLEYLAYPAKLEIDADTLNGQFEPALEQYLIWRTASILASLNGKPISDWKEYENQWFEQMDMALSKRVDNAMFIGEFRR